MSGTSTTSWRQDAPWSVEAGRGSISFVPPRLLRATGPAGSTVFEANGFDGGCGIHVWTGDGWACLVGDEGVDVIITDVEVPEIRTVGQLDRLDFGGRYDPGGLHRVAFHPLDAGDVVIEFELGLARVSRTAGLRWQRVHRDLTARVTGIDPETIWCRSEDTTFGYSLRDGRDASPRPSDPDPSSA